MQHVFHLALNGLFIDLRLLDLRAIGERGHGVHLGLNLIGEFIVHADNLEVPIDIRRVGRFLLGPHKRKHRTAGTRCRHKAK